MKNVAIVFLTLSACASAATHTKEAPAKQASAAEQARAAFRNPGGMWLPAQLSEPAHAQAFTAMGVALGPADLKDPLAAPLGAVVSLGGCTGSFVSAQGLVVTNHHCVQGALQYNSKPEENLVENGFLAKTQAEERSAGPAARIMVAQSIKDVTADMRDGLEKIADAAARKKERERRSKTLVAACEKDRPGLRCTVHTYYRGDRSELVEYLEIKDVRLVYVPRRSIGNYGGEIDNWAWPRHTGDFAFYRAYVGADGKPAELAKENVPYKPKHFLKVSTAALAPSDFVMVAGYPGSTDRTQTALEMQFDTETLMPYVIAFLKERYALAEELVKAGGNTAIKAGVMKQSVQNGLENYEGKLKGLAASGALAKKQAADRLVREWAKSHEKEAADIARLDKVIADEQATMKSEFDRNTTIGASALLRSALLAVRLAEERTKPDTERKPGFQERDMNRLLARQKSMTKDFDRALDRAVLTLALTHALALPEAERPWLATMLGAKGKLDAKAIAAAIEAFYKGTKLEDEATRLQLVGKATPAELAASKDPFVIAAVALWPFVKAAEARDDRLEGDLLLVAPAYIAGLRATTDKSLAPDANGTLRITYGTILPPPGGAVPFTKAAELVAKDTGKAPFDAPALLLAKIKEKAFGPYLDPALADLPVDFMSDLDITGGNSGSPTLNGLGELVGLAFDGTIDGVASDVVFNPEKTRTIHVDSRYMVWVMDAVDQADNVLTEMGIVPSL